mmetsp:Transcript_27685/g.43216  ORF Transcript_27685/g.43216 Transcript_27685/m.43216 type:complete len:116 (+) Transcript_27685:745-1092(+)
MLSSGPAKVPRARSGRRPAPPQRVDSLQDPASRPAVVEVWEGWHKSVGQFTRDFFWNVSNKVAESGIRETTNELTIQTREAFRSTAITARDGLASARGVLEDAAERFIEGMPPER